MKLFYKYVRCHIKRIILFILMCSVFSVVFILYKLPVQAVIYPMILCAFIGAVFLIVDFYGAKEKHIILESVKRVPIEIDTYLGNADGILDEDYCEIIKMLRSKITELENESEKRYNEMINYYTIWVHQIKTPIASMNLKLQNEDTVLSRKLSSDLFHIEQYVEMVLAYLRLDSDSNDYIFKEHSIDVIIKQAVKKFAQEFIDGGIRLFYEPVYGKVVTDEKWLSFVIEQVLSNAIKYTRNGIIKIYIEKPKILCIEDNGMGIDAQDLPRIFENGYTGYNGRMDKKASGIGLYLCKRVCDNLGIGICAESEPGKGTIIKIDLKQYEMSMND